MNRRQLKRVLSLQAVEKASGCGVFAPKVYKGTSSGQKHRKYMQNRLILDVSDDFFFDLILFCD